MLQLDCGELILNQAWHLQAWLRMVRKHAEDLARLISLEEGKPLSESLRLWPGGIDE
jgi:acyl-CoA reductase-like NAD-dependent aldehyde dehydrogenase